MSFILEALRRAERERNAAQTPELRIVTDASGAHIAAPERPPWALIAGGGGLALGIVALLIVLLRSPAEAPGDAAAPAAAPAITAAPAAAGEEEMAMGDPADPQRLDDLVDPESGLTEDPPAPQQQYTPRLEAEPQFTPAPAREAEPEPVAEAAPEPQIDEMELAPSPLPQARQLKDMPPDYRADFPKIALDVHFYDEDPARRFVMLNGKRYREGDTTAEGPRVAQITEDGVVLNHRGQDILLPAM